EPAGGVALGTFQTVAEFKDVRITADEKNLLQSDFARDASGWTSKAGSWKVQDGAFQQSDPKASASVTSGELAWKDYTLSLKARKLSGAEGFLITVRRVDAENCVVWNLGGFGNKSHSLQFRLGQQDHPMAQTPGTIEAGRWYDLKVRLSGSRVECFLDGKLMLSADIPPVKTQTVYASATRDEKAGEIILKLVNPGAEARECRVNLAGVTSVKPNTRSFVLTGANGNALNTLDEPRRVVPLESTLNLAGPNFNQRLPARSFSVFRIVGTTN
ncbi:MAG: DUF1080 domain-containing protein, partial [Akkermansiaceae bacterium]|nr:DUF1080 domain-containing protein [Verrucomicrobiales bacterium]